MTNEYIIYRAESIITEYDGEVLTSEQVATIEAAVGIARIRERMFSELGCDYERIKELVKADKEGRILIIQDAEFSDETKVNFINSLLKDLNNQSTIK